MSSRAISGIRADALAALSCGACAAAIALAPDAATKTALAACLALGIATWWSLQHRARWVRLFLLAAILLPPLPVALGDSGPHPALAAAAIGGFVSLIWLNEWTIEPVTWTFGALTFTMLFSLGPAAFYSGPSTALASLARVMLFAITPFLFTYVSSGPGKDYFLAPLQDVRLLYWAGVAAALFACLDFRFQWPPPAGFSAQYVWLDSGVYRRAQGLFYEASTLGNFCTFFLVMIAVSFAGPARGRPVGRTALFAGGAVLLAALLVSYSRGSVVCLLVSLGVLAWLNRRRLSSVRRVAAASAGLPVAFWLIWKLFPRFVEMYWIRLTASAEYLVSSTDGVLSGRVGNWGVLLDWISGHPWQALFGIGYKTLPYTSHTGRPMVADNMYLSLLIETGIFGLAALVWLNFAVLTAARAASRSAEPARAFLGTWMFCFWAGESVQMLSGDLLTYWRVLPVYFFVLALAVRR